MLRPVTHALARKPAFWRLGSLPAQQLRFYAKDTGRSNLLDDDMLTKAGLDPDNVEGKEQKLEGGGNKKWESTARAPRSESRQVEKRTRRAWLCTGAFIAAIIAYLARPFDEKEQKQHADITSSGWELGGAFDRVYARYFTTVDTFAAPVFDKVLPDPLPAPYDRPTLVIAVDDLLVKSEWTRKYGWRVAKRPGVDYFLGYLAQYYEVVLFSDKYQAMAADTVLNLDPLRASVSYALFREATRYDNGILLKDLRHLNRDLKKVIVIDTDPKVVKLQPENALILPKWKGNSDDQDLIRLIPLLEWIGAQPIKDVRPALSSYANSPDGVLNEFERRDRINREQWAKKHHRGRASVNSLLGLSPSSNAKMMPQDAVRIESQKSYEKYRKSVEEYGKKLLEEEEQKMKNAMNEHKMTLSKWLKGEAPSAEELTISAKSQEEQAKMAKQTSVASSR